MLTPIGGETNRVVGLEMGADDCLAKPFGPRELLARVSAVLCRDATSDSDYRLAIFWIVPWTSKGTARS